MNTQRMLILGLAVVAAIAAAFLALRMMGGGAPKVAAAPPPPAIETTNVLVASQPLQAGTALNATLVHWQKWPTSAVDPAFITQAQTPNLESALQGTVVRAPLVEGEPLTPAKFVHSDSASFMAATLTPGMRALSIPITTESGAGGFVLPNDRVDILMTVQISDSPKRFAGGVVLSNVRVLAMDQTYKQDKDQKVVLAKTATLELTPDQARIVVMAQAAGPLTLALRSLGDNSKTPSVGTAITDHQGTGDDAAASAGPVKIIRFGVQQNANGRRE